MSEDQQTEETQTSVFESSDEEKEISYEVNDPEDYHKIQRLKKIHFAEEKFTQARINHDYGKAVRSSKDVPVSTVSQLAVEYLRQVEPLAKKSDSDLLERTVKIADTELTLTELLDHNGTIAVKERKGNKSLTRTRRSFNREYTYVDYNMGLNQSLRVVRLCDRFLDNHLDFSLNEETEPFEI